MSGDNSLVSWIASLVFFDLEFQEFVDRFDCISIL